MFFSLINNITIDKNLVFIILLTVFIIFIVIKQPKLIATLILIFIIYYLYKRNFTNPKEFTTFIQSKVTEAFEPCSLSNQAYCGSDGSASNMTFLPDIMRAALPNNSINNNTNVKLKLEDYTIDKRLKLGKEEISMETIIASVPLLLDYKLYLERLIKFILNIKTDDNIQKDFLAKKLRYNMTKIFYNAYNTVTTKIYPAHIYNELLYSQREFNDTLNILILLGLDDFTNNKMLEYIKEFKTMNDKLNEYIIEKVNDITPNDYDINTSFLPRKGEPTGVSEMDNRMGLSYIDL